VTHHRKRIEELEAENTSLREQLRVAQQDANRYNWLRKQMTWQNCWADKDGSRIKWVIWVSMPEPNIQGELTPETVPAQLDAGIDAAISTTPPAESTEGKT
jgi:hypothetical protein